MKKVLNVGGNNKEIPLPKVYKDFEHCLLDIDPKGSPDILCDARELHTLEASQFDAIYCSHNMEHYYPHEVPKVLAGFLHVLKEGGFAHIKVPDVVAVMKEMLNRELDIDDVLYESDAGNITTHDVLYGYGKEIEQSGEDFFAHKTGFTKKKLTTAVQQAGFSNLFVKVGVRREISIFCFKGEPDKEMYDTLSGKTQAAG